MPVLHLPEIDCLAIDPLAPRRRAEEIAQVGAADCRGHGDRVALGDLMIDPDPMTSVNRSLPQKAVW